MDRYGKALGVIILFSLLWINPGPSPAAVSGCLACHNGIESIREESSAMLQLINSLSAVHGDTAGCVMCHGGDPTASDAAKAHEGSPQSLVDFKGPQTFYPDPGAMDINKFTCGQSACHAGYEERLEKSLMNTEAGKIQGNLHTWGIPEVQNHKVPWGNYDVKDGDGPVPSVGTDAYKAYMKDMIAAHKEQFPTELAQIPQPSVDEIEKDPKLAGFTYQRQQCQRCHVTVKGREKRGDYRGQGCSSCHIPYGNEGIYEGGDPTIDKTQKGHMLTHQIQATRKSKVTVGDTTYSGIPVETCNSCHNRGKRIGVTYQGLMEFPYGSPYSETGGKQPKLHTKNYLFISDDLHHQIKSRPENPEGGLLCQDCHTTIDMHGDGNIPGTTLAQVEVECQDCHGTPEEYPWELPLGHGEEFAKSIGNSPRGLANSLLQETAAFATVYDKKDGYLLSARGNPYGNVVKDGDTVIMHSATGNDFKVPLLKKLAEDDAWRNSQAMVAMASVKKHAESLECYACHASWVPQCYGCHVDVDYGPDKNGKPKQDTDWIASGSLRYPDGSTAESPLGTKGIQSPGKVSETRSYLRWEEPVLGINGEGRVTPLMPGCQVIWTVRARDGSTVAHNQIAMAYDEQKELGQERVPLGLDMAPVQPHSAQRKARTCESCHNNPKAQGYGISGGVFSLRYTENVVEDLIDQRTGKPIPSNFKIQIPKIEALDFDLSTIIKDGQQTQTVGSHWPLSRALPQEVRDAMDRTGLCMGCHREMTNADLWSKVSEPGRLTDAQHIELMNKMLQAYSKE
ncbi:MAG: cytochrome C [Gammaproteobacteria bacterium]|nr:cytochrome C [Gammaproteobacteria bacterium]